MSLSQRPKVEVDPYYLERVLREVERNRKELASLRAESRITNGFLNLADKLSRRDYGDAACAGEDAVSVLKKDIAVHEHKIQQEQTKRTAALKEELARCGSDHPQV